MDEVTTTPSTCDVVMETNANDDHRKAIPMIKRDSPNSDHRIADHVSGQKLFVCDICSKVFSRKEYLRFHRLSHLGVVPFKCQICGKDFERSFPYKKHLKTHETEERRRQKKLAKVYKCKTCRQTFPEKSTWVDHTKSEHPRFKIEEDTDQTKPFSCEICGKNYKQAICVKRHKVIHVKKPFHCNICKNNFLLDEQLVSHQRSHKSKLIK